MNLKYVQQKCLDVILTQLNNFFTNIIEHILRIQKKNLLFASKFSKILDEYRYPNFVQESICKDIENDTFLSEVIRTFIKQHYPSYQNVNELKLHAEPIPSQLNGAYRIDGNIRMDELNTIHHQLGYPGSF